MLILQCSKNESQRSIGWIGGGDALRNSTYSSSSISGRVHDDGTELLFRQKSRCRRTLLRKTTGQRNNPTGDGFTNSSCKCFFFIKPLSPYFEFLFHLTVLQTNIRYITLVADKYNKDGFRATVTPALPVMATNVRVDGKPVLPYSILIQFWCAP